MDLETDVNKGAYHAPGLFHRQSRYSICNSLTGYCSFLGSIQEITSLQGKGSLNSGRQSERVQACGVCWVQIQGRRMERE